MTDFDLTYLSLGAGRQSTALAILAAEGALGDLRPSIAIFANTGDEPQYVYDHLWNLSGWLEARGLPVEIVRYGHLSEDILTKRTGKRARLPMFVRNDDGTRGMVRRQCTTAYKIEPIERCVKSLMGLGKGQRAKGVKQARALLGISLDECDRMRTNVTPWITNVYPLIDLGLRTSDCERICMGALGYVPGKSSCVFCPYKSPSHWKWLKRNHPAEFEKACSFDDALRAQEIESMKSMRGAVYVHSSLRPLRDIDFGDSQKDLFSDECSGVCGV